MQPEFALCFRGRLWDEIESTGSRLHDMGQVKFSRPWTVIRARMRLRKLLKENQYNVAICHACWPHAVYGSTVRRSDTKLIGWIHDALNGKHWLDKAASRIGADLLIANSQYTAACSTRIFGDIPTEIVYLPVEKTVISQATDCKKTLRNNLTTSQDDIVILQACRLDRWKGHSILIKALATLRDLHGWTAWIAGGPQRDSEKAYLAELKKLSHLEGIEDRVRFLGQRNDVPILMSTSDIYCQPNTSPEPFGVAFIEALYAGLPIVTSKIGGGAEIVDNGCGLLTTIGNVAEVSKSLRMLIEDSELRKSLSRNGPARAAQLCDPSISLNRINEVIAACTAAPV